MRLCRRLLSQEIDMDTERKIMEAIVRTDMFLVTAWRYMLVFLFLAGIGLLIYLNRKQK